MFGYAGKLLKIDLSSDNFSLLETSNYTGKFLGGRGIAIKMFWDMVPSDASAFSPDNLIAFITGPLTGYPGLASSRVEVCSRSPSIEPETFTYASLGGGWGVRLKYAGYDGLVIQGKAEKPVYLYLHDNKIEIKEAAGLWGKTTSVQAYYMLQKELGKGTSVLSIGPAGENLVSFATMFADENAIASGGLGGVMGSKNLKAIVIAANINKPPVANNNRLDQLSGQLLQSFVPKNESYPPWVIPGKSKDLICRGCGIGHCMRRYYTDPDGYRARIFCQAGEFYRVPAEKFYTDPAEAVLKAERLCDSHGLCTSVMQGIVEWLTKCRNEGALDEKNTGLPLSKIGSEEFIESLVKKISYREGFGDLLAQGTQKAARATGGKAEDIYGYSILTRANEYMDHDPRLLPHNILLFATESRRNVDLLHESSVLYHYWNNWHRDVSQGKIPEGPFTLEFFRQSCIKYWGSLESADYSTLEGKALAAKRIQDRVYTRACTILCGAQWGVFPNTKRILTDPNLVAQLLNAVTGREFDEKTLEVFGERIINLQRSIMMRQGWGGRKGDVLLPQVYESPLVYSDINMPPPHIRMSNYIVPDEHGAPVSKKGAVLDRQSIENLKSEYYELRGWDSKTGLQKRAKLNEMGLNDVADNLETRGLLAST